ncbi:MAG TPA: DedA family protein [Nocardioides sp.]|nr:DedA family protein [Nocardioides sp.]
MGTLIDSVAGLPAWLLLLLVFALPAAEAALFIGLVIPGETTIILGGVAAHQGRLSLGAVMLAAVAGAVLGDQVGFLVGRRYGVRLLERVPQRWKRSGSLQRALDLLDRRGAVAVATGRWVAALRALVPGLAGMSGLGRVRFTVANVLGGTLWAVTMALLGYLAGASYRALEQRLGVGSDILAGVVLLAVVGWLWWGRRHRPHPSNGGS